MLLWQHRILNCINRISVIVVAFFSSWFKRIFWWFIWLFICWCCWVFFWRNLSKLKHNSPNWCVWTVGYHYRLDNKFTQIVFASERKEIESEEKKIVSTIAGFSSVRPIKSIVFFFVVFFSALTFVSCVSMLYAYESIVVHSVSGWRLINSTVKRSLFIITSN